MQRYRRRVRSGRPNRPVGPSVRSNHINVIVAALFVCWPFFLPRPYWWPVLAGWVLFLVVIVGVCRLSRR